jgi:hypothetical protein
VIRIRFPVSAAAVALAAAAAALAAQQPAAPPRSPTLTNTEVPWRLSYFPYLSGLSNDGPLISARGRYAQQAPYEARVTTNAALTLDAGIGFRGTRFVLARFVAPRLAPGWRFHVLGLAAREARFGFFGIGNETTYDPDNVTDANPLFYRVQRTSYRGQVEATRQLTGPLHFALLSEAVWAKFVAPTEGTSVFAQTIGGPLRQGDVSFRGALVLDTRDVEYDPHRGVLLEAGGQVATGGTGYQRLYAVLRGWAEPRPGTVLAARVAGSQLYGSPTLDAEFVIPGWERPIYVLGGQFSFRGVDTGRYVGEGVLFGNFEVRQEVKSFGGLGAIMVLGLVDAGRVFQGEKFRLTTGGVKVGAGGGIALRVLRSNIFSLSLARGPGRTRLTFGFGWMF